MQNGNQKIREDPVSRYRAELMGASILMIMLCHSTFYIPHIFLANTYGLLKHMAQSGVDMFLFLSGMGCWHSLTKRPGIAAFWKRRLKRLLPLYCLIVPVRIAVDVLADGYTLPGAVYRYSLVSFFLDGELVTWFIAGLLVLYLLFPFIYYLLNKQEKLFWTLLVLYTAAMCAVSWYSSRDVLWWGLRRWEIFYMRIPAFLAGAWYAARLNRDRSDSFFPRLGLCAVSFVYLFVLCLCNERYNTANMWFVFRLLFLPLALTLLSGLTQLFERSNGNRFMSYLGKLTLELYLLHEWILHISSKIVFAYVQQNLISSVLLNAFAAISAVLLADGIRLLIGRLRIKRKDNQER